MSFEAPFLITLRESLEAFLIISIFAGLVAKIGWPQARKYLLYGAGTALVVSVLAGAFVLAVVGRIFQGETEEFQETFEGVASLVAVAILTYMIVWMYRHTLQTIVGLRKQAVQAYQTGRPMVLFMIAFVAVMREGLETVLFFATQAATTTPAVLVLAALGAIALSATLAFLVFTGIVRLNIKKFFTVTGVLLIFFAGGLLVTGIHELSEVGWIPGTSLAWDTGAFLDQSSPVGAFAKALFGYREKPSILEAAAYFLYVIGLGAWYLSALLRRLGRGTVQEPAPTEAPAPT